MPAMQLRSAAIPFLSQPLVPPAGQLSGRPTHRMPLDTNAAKSQGSFQRAPDQSSRVGDDRDSEGIHNPPPSGSSVFHNRLEGLRRDANREPRALNVQDVGLAIVGSCIVRFVFVHCAPPSLSWIEGFPGVLQCAGREINLIPAAAVSAALDSVLGPAEFVRRGISRSGSRSSARPEFCQIGGPPETSAVR